MERGPATEIFRIFLRLGLTSFGGPIAHLGYFRDEFVRRRAWIDDAAFAQLVSVCQFLPGPASSQLGFAIGLMRAGGKGALSAFVAFTLPSAMLMFALALFAPRLLVSPLGLAFVHGLKLVAVVVVSDGVFRMARTLAPDRRRALIALGSCALVVAGGDAWWQVAAIIVGGFAGLSLNRISGLVQFALPPVAYGRRVAGTCFLVFLGLLAWSLVPTGPEPSAGGLAGAFYRSGALVFGGGHVVLPLLEQQLVTPGWMHSDTFLAGYGAAQAMPGPMFSLSAYLGASVDFDAPKVIGAMLALACVFLPGFLLLIAALPAWTAVVERPWATRMTAGVNAAVVGVLAAALYDPVVREGISGAADVVIVAAGLALLQRFSALWVVAWCVAAAVGWGWLAQTYV
jgi:chromate transporter